MAHNAISRRSEKAISTHLMMTRSTTSAVVGRASSMRRLRRRTHSAYAAGETRTFCRTNGCPSFLEADPTTAILTCPICAYTPRVH